MTNKVRHAFEVMDPEEAAAATHLFLTFCKLAGIDNRAQVHLLERNLDLWKDRSSLIEKNSIISRMQQEVSRLQEKNRDLLQQKLEYERLSYQIKELQLKLGQNALEMRKERETARYREARLDKLRAARNALIQERNTLLDTLKSYAELEKYLRYLGRLSLYTSTRLDYERSISQLTPEQEEVLSSIRLKKDFLIKGGAGTGKSLVLIECLRRAALQKELDFGENQSVVLVTFTRTLAKYNRYLSELRGIDFPLDVISTVDTLFFNKLQALYPGFRYDFELLEPYFNEENTPEFQTAEELISEIENFLFANGITEEKYLDRLTPRTGMRRKLSKQQRKKVWRIREELVGTMEANRVYTKNYGRLKLLGYLEGHPDDMGIRDISYLFLDEVQDLTPVALMILRQLTRRTIVMAGDSDQSLYNYESPLSRTSFKLRGKTRILKTNFRNTRQIHALAENFRKRGPHTSRTSNTSRAEPDSRTRAFPFREGPVPELYVSDSEESCRELLVEKLAIFIEDLGYDPDNLCILVPRNREIEIMSQDLKKTPYEAVNINSEEFSFKETGKLRISTLHSSKGLDFPVVLIYLPYIHRRRQYDDEQTEKLIRNLVYVGITRAMDNVNVFTVNGDDPVLKDLIAACRTSSGAKEQLKGTGK